ncbi:hypothetical protein BC834DRAFT_589987 [Gloeopeniophorella convolvens]|nr:hypothetical protein BC834DRAFT_589987 [Gloeopeniophorella convolvens]
MPHLRNLSVSFRRPVSRLAAKKWMPRKHRPRTVLPALNSLEFQGSSTYLESLLVRADTPQLKRFHITFSNQLGFTLAELSRLAEANMLIRDKQLTVTFTEEFVGVIGGSEAQDLQAFADRSLADWHYMGDFSVRVRCSRFDWQVFAASQICAALAPLVPPVQKLNLRCGASGQWLCYQDEVDHTCWHRLLQPFRATGTLLIERTLIQELSRALERRDNALELLPALQSVEIGQTGYDISASGCRWACTLALSLIAMAVDSAANRNNIGTLSNDTCRTTFIAVSRAVNGQGLGAVCWSIISRSTTSLTGAPVNSPVVPATLITGYTTPAHLSYHA